jgi:hypothetical protein
MRNGIEFLQDKSGHLAIVVKLGNIPTSTVKGMFDNLANITATSSTVTVVDEMDVKSVAQSGDYMVTVFWDRCYLDDLRVFSRPEEVHSYLGEGFTALDQQQAKNAIEELSEFEIDLEGDEEYTKTARKAYKAAYGE